MQFHTQQRPSMQFAAMAILCMATLLTGCKSAHRNTTTDQAITYATPYDAPSPKLSRDGLLDMDRLFVLQYTIGGFPGGRNVLIIDSTGRGRYILTRLQWDTSRNTSDGSVQVIYDPIDFRLSDNAIQNLRKKLATDHFEKLQPIYINPKWADGTSITITLSVNDMQQSVFCQNLFPRPVRSLQAYLEARIIPAHAPVLGLPQINRSAEHSSLMSLQLN